MAIKGAGPSSSLCQSSRGFGDAAGAGGIHRLAGRLCVILYDGYGRRHVPCRRISAARLQQHQPSRPVAGRHSSPGGYLLVIAPRALSLPPCLPAVPSALWVPLLAFRCVRASSCVRGNKRNGPARQARHGASMAWASPGQPVGGCHCVHPAPGVGPSPTETCRHPGYLHCATAHHRPYALPKPMDAVLARAAPSLTQWTPACSSTWRLASAERKTRPAGCPPSMPRAPTHPAQCPRTQRGAPTAGGLDRETPAAPPLEAVCGEAKGT